VIVVGPQLKLHQCGLPKLMALELFKPYIFNKLETMGLATTIKAAKKMVETQEPVVWDILEDVIREHPVMLNRAPTLHRLGIQAFEPVLIEGKAIQLHPLVCTAFNADFDGDQMAGPRAAVARSADGSADADARVEQRAAAVERRALHRAVAGHRARPLLRDARADQREGRGHAVRRPREVQRAYESRQVELHAKIQVRLKQTETPPGGEPVEKIVRVETTVGRALLSEILPTGLPFSTINKPLKKKEISRIINASFRRCGLRETVIFADKLMQAGYALATRGGISFAADDMLIPAEKHAIIEKSENAGEGDRGAVHLGSRHAGRALQQGRRHLGPRR
jgi:DNA-directed RNA polymerase subunit beta'